MNNPALPHLNCNYLGELDHVCNKCGQFVDLSSVLIAFRNLTAQAEYATEIGALAMCHYYHGEHANIEWKNDHAGRAMREEHIKWAKENYKKIENEQTSI